MPYLFEFEPVQAILRCSMSGQVTDQQLLECYRTAIRHVRQKNPLVSIVDLTGVTSILVSPATVQGLARCEPVLCPSRPRFIIAPTDHLYGLSRMYQIVGERVRPRLQVVRSLAEVFAAAGLDELHFEPVH
jgi:hypothetical protein